MTNQAALHLSQAPTPDLPEIEARSYSSNSTDEETQAIMSRVYLLEANVIYWQEVPVMSCWQVERFGEKLDQLQKELDEFYLLLDLSGSKPPNAPIREALRKVFTPLPHSGLVRASAFTEKNFFINVAAKLVLGGSGLSFSVHTKRAEAELALRK